MPQKLPTDLNLSFTNQLVQTKTQSMGLEQESNLQEGEGYFIRQPSMGLQQQHLNTQRKFSPVQGSLLEHSIRLILQYNELISQCHLQPVLSTITVKLNSSISRATVKKTLTQIPFPSVLVIFHFCQTEVACVCILQVYSIVINFTDWILDGFLRELFNFGKLREHKKESLYPQGPCFQPFIIIILY